MKRMRVLELGLAALLLATLGSVGCSSRRHPAHSHLHEYRHGYYNPVDGYFHDDHWHANGPQVNRGPYPHARAPRHHDHGPYPARPRTVTYNYW